ncbi:MAG: lycopene cyclase family protein, partial [Chitinophagaceae bacterium]
LNDTEYLFDNAILFNSIYKGESKDKKAIRLLQHFKGWIIETKEPSFDPQKATMMDFRINQNSGTSFVYVLPFNEKSALVEFTLFTKELLQQAAYDKQLKEYIDAFLKIDEYKITEQEFGVIPMTNEKFSFEKNGWNIGTAGGQTKASSGYTFQFIQKQSQQIFECLINQKPLSQIPTLPRRFRFYDNTLLDILYHNKLPGKEIFTTLFQKNKPQQVLRFLDNESSIKDELKIISSLPTWPFLKAAIKQF